MGRGPALRTWRTLAGVAVAWLLAGSAGTAQAALSDRLCAPSGGTLSAYPSGGELQAAATMVEQRLARRGAADPYADMKPALDLATPDAARPSPLAIAEYCVAAGELMRVSAQGSQLQAQSYLLSAFQTANAAGLLKPASLAAYRLGLVSLSGSTATGTRGAGASRGRTRGPTATAQEAVAVTGGGPCDVLRATSVLLNTNLRLSFASLACSAQEARAGGDMRTAALADLRLARLRLAIAEANTELAGDLRAQAWTAAADGLSAARGIDEP